MVEYYYLYKDLMSIWQSEYSDRIYNLNYETLTTDQEENQSRKLIKYLELNWKRLVYHQKRINVVLELPHNYR